MGRRNQLPKYQVWSQFDSTLSAPSEKSVVDQCDVVRYVVTVDSTVVGELFVEFTDDRSPNPSQLTWKSFDFAQPLIIDGSQDTEYFITLKEHSAQSMRLSFVNNGGTGNIDAWIVATNIGA